MIISVFRSTCFFKVLGVCITEHRKKVHLQKYTYAHDSFSKTKNRINRINPHGTVLVTIEKPGQIVQYFALK
jgi:hypothetical protein